MGKCDDIANRVNLMADFGEMENKYKANIAQITPISVCVKYINSDLNYQNNYAWKGNNLNLHLRICRIL